MLEAISIAGFVLAWGTVIVRVVQVVPGSRLLWLAPVSLAIGFLAADFIGGAVHWFADTYFEPATPIVGPLLIEPFRAHHADPEGIARHGFLELSGNNALGTLPLAALLLSFGGTLEGVAAQAVHVALTALALALFATNGFHCWAHMPSPPCLVAWLQQNRVVLGPEAHALHHSGAHNRSYCVTSGWLNPLLDRWRFFARIEAALAGVRIVRRPQADPRVSRRRRAGAGAR